MFVIKRSGRKEEINFDKITRRIASLADLDGSVLGVDVIDIAKKVVSGVYDGVHTSELDTLACETAAQRITVHPDYGLLASRIFVSSMHKETPDTFCGYVKSVSHLLRNEFLQTVESHQEDLDVMIDSSRDYLLSYFGLKTLEKSYLLRNVDGKLVERPQYMFLRVAIAIHGTDMHRVKETYDLMSTKHFIHATPTLYNAGKHRQQLSSCFLTQIEKDSIDGIFNTVKNCALISKSAGGIGLSVSNVRATGSPISGGGTSNGLLPMLRVLNNVARYVDQGGNKRPGAIAVYIEPWHADIFDILELRKNHGKDELRARDLFTALWVPDIFMCRVKANDDWSLFCPSLAPGLDECWGAEFDTLYTEYERTKPHTTIKAQKLWAAIVASQIETGTPYMLYKDACNRTSNHNHLGTIKGSNLCVAPETNILTKNGYLRIDTLKDKSVEIWNGYEWSMVTVRQTSIKSKLLRVTLANNLILECTPEHKFYLKNGAEVAASDLVPGDKLLKWTPPDDASSNDSFESPYTHGFFCGDGTYHKTYAGERLIPGIALYDVKKKLLPYLDIRSSSGKEDSSGRINVLLHRSISPKFLVPLTANLNDKIKWLEGLCDADGCIQRCPGNPTQLSLSIGSNNLQFLKQIGLMLNTIGATGVIGLLHKGGERLMPNGKNGKKVYTTLPTWRIAISAFSVKKLVDNGFSPKRLNVSNFSSCKRDTRRYPTILSVEDTGREDATYCFTEPKRHMGVFNGILTGQCTEILEHFDKDETAVCNLASIGLPAFVHGGKYNLEELHRVVQVITRNLDTVIDINDYPIPQAEKSNRRHRPIGIGVQGLADAFIALGLPFDSQDARELNRHIFETIYHAALTASADLAREKGVYASYNGSRVQNGLLHCDGYRFTPCGLWDWDKLRKRISEHGVRNSLLVAPMPTASTSQILGYNECFEPYTSNIYNRRVKSGEFQVVNTHLVKALDALGLWNTHTKNEIIRNNGSIAAIPQIPSDVKLLFRTVWEIPQKAIIEMAADRGVFIDQSQSLNIHLEDATLAKITSMHFYGWERGLKTGMYYLRTRPASKSIQFTIEPVRKCSIDNPSCESCSG